MSNNSTNINKITSTLRWNFSSWLGTGI